MHTQPCLTSGYDTLGMSNVSRKPVKGRKTKIFKSLPVIGLLGVLLIETIGIGETSIHFVTYILIIAACLLYLGGVWSEENDLQVFGVVGACGTIFFVNDIATIVLFVTIIIMSVLTWGPQLIHFFKKYQG